MNTIASRVRKGSVWIACSRALTNGLGLISTIVLARLLVPADFGLVAIGTTILTIATATTDISLTQAIIHYDEPEDRHLHCAWTLNAIRGLLLAVLFIATAPAIARFYGDPRLANVMVVIASSVFCSGLGNPRLALLKRDLVFWQDFVLQATQKLAMVAVSVTVAILTHSYFALIAGIVVGEIAQLVVSYIFVPFMPRIRFKEARELFAFSGWLTLGQIVQTINWRLDPLIIGKFLGAHELGLFTVSNNLSQLPTRETTQPLIATLFPAFRQIRNDPDRLRAACTRVQTLISAIALPSGFIMALLSQPFILLVMGTRWLEASYIIQVLAITIAVQTLGTIAYPVAMATGGTQLIFKRSLQALSFRLPITLAGLYLDGLRGLLIARTILCVTSTSLDMAVVKQVTALGFRHQIWSNRRTIASCLVMSLAVLLSGRVLSFGTGTFALIATILVNGSIALATYLATMFGLWSLTGKPIGPEREFAQLAGNLVRRFVPVRAAPKGR